MIEALITGAVAIIVCMVNNHYQQRQTEKQHDKTIALIDYKLGELQKKVEKHNEVVERTYRLEEGQAVIKEQIKVVNHRIGDLEEERED